MGVSLPWPGLKEAWFFQRGALFGFGSETSDQIASVIVASDAVTSPSTLTCVVAFAIRNGVANRAPILFVIDINEKRVRSSTRNSLGSHAKSDCLEGMASKKLDALGSISDSKVARSSTD